MEQESGTTTPTVLTTSHDTRPLGASGVTVSALGVGTWAWGDKAFWGYGKTYTRTDIAAAFHASLAAGVDFFDTAEVYGGGMSERLLGAFARTADVPVLLASKFAPLPTRLSAVKALPQALDATLARLGVERLDLYQIHFPVPWMRVNPLMDALAAAVRMGKVRAVGVSNFPAKLLRQAHARLATHGVPLASNQVQYSLLHRTPETNGVLDACRELNVALIAYSPLAQGVLTTRYATGKLEKPAGPRRFLPRHSERGREQVRPVLDTLARIAAMHGKTVEQVALNWLISRDNHIIPIPGAKRAAQAEANAGTLGWRLTADEIATLDAASERYRNKAFWPLG